MSDFKVKGPAGPRVLDQGNRQEPTLFGNGRQEKPTVPIGPQARARPVAAQVAQYHGQTNAARPDQLLGAVFKERYKIEKRLGAGGMGDVYLGIDSQTGQKVAVKVVKRMFGDRDAMTRYFREIRAAKKVRHDNIVRILDEGMYGERLFFVMEHLEGIDLAEHIWNQKNEGKMMIPWKEAKPILMQICDALDAVHRAGIMHRDLKPQNIFLEHGTKVKVLDFGLAKRDEDDDHTRDGTVMGSASYMSPEMAYGKKADYRADIYAVGIIMYELLAGDLPFKGTYLEKIELHKYATPMPPRQHCKDIPEAVETIILRAMEKAPDERFQSIKDMMDAMEIADNDSALRAALLRDSISESRRPVHADSEAPQAGMFDDEEDDDEERSGWIGKTLAVGALAVAVVAGAAYTYRSEIMPHLEPYVERGRERAEELLNNTEKEETPQRAEVPKPVVESKTFTATIESVPADATVYKVTEENKKGEEVGTTKEPLELKLDKGEHRFMITRAGYGKRIVVVSPQNPAAKVVLNRRKIRRLPNPVAPEGPEEGSGAP